MPYGFGRKLTFVPAGLDNLNLPSNPFNVLATMAPVNPTEHGHDDNYSPRSLEPCDPSPSQHHLWTWVHLTVGKLRIPPRTRTHFIRRMSQDEYTGPLPWMKPSIPKANPHESIFCPVHPRRHHLARWKGSWRREYLFQKKGVSQHFCQACEQMIPSEKDIPGPSTKD